MISTTQNCGLQNIGLKACINKQVMEKKIDNINIDFDNGKIRFQKYWIEEIATTKMD